MLNVGANDGAYVVSFANEVGAISMLSERARCQSPGIALKVHSQSIEALAEEQVILRLILRGEHHHGCFGSETHAAALVPIRRRPPCGGGERAVLSVLLRARFGAVDEAGGDCGT